MKNIEIKAQIENIDEVELKAKQISDTDRIVIVQTDTFFHVLHHETGRLKLRQFEDGSGELIYYERPNIKGPKLSKYEKTALDSAAYEGIRSILSLSNNVLGKVHKVRHLYTVGQTRIHIDRVSDLGNFLELEVVLRDEEDLEVGKKISEDLLQKLGIKEDRLISGAYLDLLANKK